MGGPTLSYHASTSGAPERDIVPHKALAGRICRQVKSDLSDLIDHLLSFTIKKSK
jgi:hypothetical protein